MTEPRVYAPEFASDLTWLNTRAPISMRALRGQVVVLDFWTYCCVNCMHVAPVLAAIEERLHGEPLVVLGVHSAKFDGEKDAARIDDAIRRYDVRHAVLVDRDMATWQAYAVRSWPTLIVVRPDGTLAAVAPGEPDPAALEQLLRDELARGRKNGTLATVPFAVDAPARASDGALAYPGKVAVNAYGAIAVADSGHHRVLVLDADGRVVHAIGSGLAGHADGALEAAAFEDPQGVLWASPSTLFVADARTHTVRRIDLTARTVTTIAGTGVLGAAPIGAPQPARETALRSPWDLALEGDRLYVALAGSHQIGVIDLARGTVAALAGTGAESKIDGPFAEATFAQPSGLALRDEGRALYVADSETSAVRELRLDAGTVRTLVGTGLFDFGDRDGAASDALLQHNVGIALGGGALVTADTYNHKLRQIDATTGAVSTIASGLAEPGGLAWDAAREAWLVADTNAHRLVRIDARGTTPVAVTGAPTPKRGRLPRPEAAHDAGATAWFTTTLAARDGAALRPGAATIELAVLAPAGRKFAAGSRLAMAIEVSRRSDLILLPTTELRAEARGGAEEAMALTAEIAPFAEEHIDAEMVVRIDGITCDESADAEGAVCAPFRAWLRVPVRLEAEGGHQVRFDAT